MRRICSANEKHKTFGRHAHSTMFICWFKKIDFSEKKKKKIHNTRQIESIYKNTKSM